MTMTANFCAVDTKKLGRPMKQELPEVKKYTAMEFWTDVLESNNKGELIKALGKTLPGSVYASRMPLEVRNKIIKLS